MPQTPAEFAMTLFTLCNALRLFAYVPQIICVLRDKDGAEAVSILSWSLLAIANFSTAVYAALVLNDQRVTLIFAANTVCCAAISAATAWQREHRTLPITARGPLSGEGKRS